VTEEAPRVAVVERKGKLWLRWYDATAKNGDRFGGFRYRSLGVEARTDAGHLVAETVAWAAREAELQRLRLLGLVAAPEKHGTAPVTIEQGRVLILDADRGKYPVDTPHRREVARALRVAEQVWGPSRAWDSLTAEDWRTLWRQRIRGLKADQSGRVTTGHRGVVITVARLRAVAMWLLDEHKATAHGCLPPSDWRGRVLADWRLHHEGEHDPEPDRPRYTVDEVRRFLPAAMAVDPRFALLVAIGAEQRPGQVARVRRSQVDRRAGTVDLKRRGKKKGAVIQMTPGQRAVMEQAMTAGYLRDLEAHHAATGEDYRLFPQGRLEGWQAEGGDLVLVTATGQRRRKGHRMVAGELRASVAMASRDPVSASAIGDWWDEAERRAGIPKLPGRRTYAIRRASADYNLDAELSERAQQEAGGWSDSRMIATVYASPEQKRAQAAARDARARFRGEAV
jgi:integrase